MLPAAAGNPGQRLDPDAVAKEMNSAFPTRAAIAAARDIILKTSACLDRGESFIIETTLAGSGPIKTIVRAREAGFYSRLIYVCVENSERSIQRVQERVARGGHDVPDEDVRRRYTRSLENLIVAARIADEAAVFDNSGSRLERVFEARRGVIVSLGSSIPAWATRAIQQLTIQPNQ